MICHVMFFPYFSFFDFPMGLTMTFGTPLQQASCFAWRGVLWSSSKRLRKGQHGRTLCNFWRSRHREGDPRGDPGGFFFFGGETRFCLKWIEVKVTWFFGFVALLNGPLFFFWRRINKLDWILKLLDIRNKNSETLSILVTSLGFTGILWTSQRHIPSSYGTKGCLCLELLHPCWGKT